MPCGYCDEAGHDWRHCPDRLEAYHGVPADDLDGEEVTDGGA